MDVIKVTPEQIHVTVDFTASEVHDIITMLNCAQLKYDTTDDRLARADATLRKMYELFVEVDKEIGEVQ